MELVVLNGQMEGHRFELDKPVVTIGRKSENDVCLPTDRRISRFHAQLTSRDDGTWIVEDLDSSNGTFVGQRRIHAPTVLHPEDRFRMGRTWLQMHKPEPAQPEHPPVEAVDIGEIGEEEFERDNVVYAVSAGEGPVEAEHEADELREYLEVYDRVSRALSSTLDQEQLFNQIMDSIMEALPAERGFLLLLDRETGELTPRVARRRSDTTGGDERATISRHMVDRAVNERVTILTTDAMSDERFQEHESVRDFGIRSAVCAPLVRGEDVLGVLYLDTTSETHVFTERDVDLIAGLASQAALAIDNARLYGDLRNAYDELKGAQEHLIRSEKLSTIGALSATIAHDMANIVTPLHPLITVMLKDVEVNEEEHEAVQRQVQRLNALVERLLSFSHAENVDLQRTNINSVVNSTLELLTTELNHRGVKREIRLAEGLPDVWADDNQMDRVFLNLCMNALEAMEDQEDQHLVIETSHDQDEVVITITDNGPGIPTDLETDIFDPFFTTKETGTGLGLFSCRRIVEADHNGVLEYESEPGRGTTFTVRLPVAEA